MLFIHRDLSHPSQMAPPNQSVESASPPSGLVQQSLQATPVSASLGGVHTMKLTKEQVAILKNYQRFRNEPPTVPGGLWREKLWILFMLVIVAVCLLNALTGSPSDWRYGFVGLAFAAGAVVVARVVVNVCETTSWPVLREVLNWDRVAELIRDNPFPEDENFMEKPGLVHNLACVFCVFMLATIVCTTVKYTSSSDLYAALASVLVVALVCMAGWLLSPVTRKQPNDTASSTGPRCVACNTLIAAGMRLCPKCGWTQPG